MITSPQELVASLDGAGNIGDPAPRTVWMFWNTGERTAPEVVQRAIATWRQFNPDHEVRVLDEACLAEEFGIDYGAIARHYTVGLGEAGKSNILRMYMLLRHGGIWADGSTFCLNPLSDWLHPQLEESGLFLFRFGPKKEDRQIANWFMASKPGDPILREVLELSVEYLTRPRKKFLKLSMLFRIKPPKELLGRETTGFPLIEFAEKQGRAPYFLNHYLFNEAIARHRTHWQKVEPQTNRFSISHSHFNVFLTADVAKFNRRSTYTNGHKYANRIEALFDGDTPSLERLAEARAARGLTRD